MENKTHYYVEKKMNTMANEFKEKEINGCLLPAQIPPFLSMEEIKKLILSTHDNPEFYYPLHIQGMQQRKSDGQIELIYSSYKAFYRRLFTEISEETYNDFCADFAKKEKEWQDKKKT